jgi:rhodanese-related sulfurtransferase
MGKRWVGVLLVGLVLAVGVVGCGSQDSGAHVKVTAKEAKQLIADKKVTILDVRTQAEFDGGHIAGATVLPVQELASRIDELDKNKPYLLVCHSGNRSTQAQTILKDAGFKQTYNLIGGVAGWPYGLVNN